MEGRRGIIVVGVFNVAEAFSHSGGRVVMFGLHSVAR